MNRLFLILSVILFSFVISSGQNTLSNNFIPCTQPVFHVDYPSPIADKPQSKLWFGDNCWWAVLPRPSGPSLWQRTEEGLKEHANVSESLSGVPDHADVWADEGEIAAIGVGTDIKMAFRFIKKNNSKGDDWEAKKLGRLPLPPDTCTIEMATIVKDANGEWWVVADIGTEIYVRNSSSDGENWTQPVKLADGVDEDDICTLAVLPGGVGIIWSNQMKETINIRTHPNGKAVDDWDGIQIIASGNHAADDHLNTAMSADDTLWLVTKNSLDEQDKPQLVLYVRLPNGRWRNFPYADLGYIRKPSRPIILDSNDNNIILAGHTIYNCQRPGLGEIVFGQVDTLENRSAAKHYFCYRTI